MSTTPVLDYVPRLVDANLNHLLRNMPRVEQAYKTHNLWDEAVWWRKGVEVLDQGQEGACVGFAVSHEATSSPVRVKDLTNHTARNAYDRAKELDEEEGVDYEGTSVRAGMLVGREFGWWEGFKWARNIAELRAGLQFGPMVVGLKWTESMYETSRHGRVIVRGREVGWHCLLINGYSPNWGQSGRHFRWLNSWGESYGNNGQGYITPDKLNDLLFVAGGEAAMPLNRHMVKA